MCITYAILACSKTNERPWAAIFDTRRTTVCMTLAKRPRGGNLNWAGSRNWEVTRVILCTDCGLGTDLRGLRKRLGLPERGHNFCTAGSPRRENARD
jgi:hypothetical protein